MHILQSFPVSCLNRDDVGAPKTATFGGATRARISSQCLKRAIRLWAKERSPVLYGGERSKLIVRPIADVAQKHSVAPEKALELSKKFCHQLATFDESAFKKNPNILKVKTLMFLSPAEREEIGKELAAILKESKDDKALDKRLKSAAAKVGEAKLKDAADIAIFGRMVASDHSLTVEGAAMFGHALSTHRADNDIDFYTAVDDRQSEDPSIEEEDRAGSGMMGTLEFTSAVYYRYAGLNLGMLEDGDHLGAVSPEDRRRIVDAFICAVVLAVPAARKNSMNAHTLPGYVLGLVRPKGQPLQLINAFEKPVSARNGLMAASVAEIKQHWQQLQNTWGIKPSLEVSIPDTPFKQFREKILSHV
ncbi:MAG: type I-E CRISPR-associated protein Cas7/Cse4/CasC [Bryobacteraceae bacterium]|nr:type I-E CRISPR-associated protein Cas7/Cse4/CasC [Bryobacteraceae bacterium]